MCWTSLSDSPDRRPGTIHSESDHARTRRDYRSLLSLGVHVHILDFALIRTVASHLSARVQYRLCRPMFNYDYQRSLVLSHKDVKKKLNTLQRKTIFFIKYLVILVYLHYDSVLYFLNFVNVTDRRILKYILSIFVSAIHPPFGVQT